MNQPRRPNSNRRAFLIVIGVAAVALTLSVLTSQPRESRPAPAKLTVDAKFDGQKFRVTNTGPDHWQDVTVRINDRYNATMAEIKAGETAWFGAMGFADKDGLRFNPLVIKPVKLSITATVGNDVAMYVGTWK